MQTVDQLLDAVKARHKITSDYKLAQYLGMTDSAIRNYRHKRSLPDEVACVKIAQALNLDGDVLAAQIQAQRARDADTKAFWRRLAARLEAGAVHVAVLVAVCLVGFTSTPNAEASTLSADASKDGRLYIMLSRVARLFRATRRALADRIGGFFGGNHVQSAHTDAAFPYPA